MWVFFEIKNILVNSDCDMTLVGKVPRWSLRLYGNLALVG